MSDTLPEDFAALEVDTIDHPPVGFVRRLIAISSEVKTFFRRLDVPFTNRRGNEYPVTPHNRGRPAPPRDFDHPRDVLGRAPHIGQSFVFNDAGSTASKVWPIHIGKTAGNEKKDSSDNRNESTMHDLNPFVKKITLDFRIEMITGSEIECQTFLKRCGCGFLYVALEAPKV